MNFDGPGNNRETLNVAFETLHRRTHIFSNTLRLVESTPFIQKHLAEQQPAIEPAETPKPFADFGRSAVEHVDAVSRVDDAQQAVERSYGDQEAA